MKYVGGTAFAIIARELGYLIDEGSQSKLAIAEVPEEDVEKFEEELIRQNIVYGKNYIVFYTPN